MKLEWPQPRRRWRIATTLSVVESQWSWITNPPRLRLSIQQAPRLRHPLERLPTQCLDYVTKISTRTIVPSVRILKTSHLFGRADLLLLSALLPPHPVQQL